MPSAGSQPRSKGFAALRTWLAVAMFAVALAGSALAGPSEDATAAYNRGDYATALRIRLEFAEQGDPAAQVLVGLMYARGHGVPRDDAQAVQWYRKAAEQDDAWGQTNLGYMYESGRGVAGDDAEAAKWYLKAAERGFAMAQDNLGCLYRDGRGVARDDSVAVSWFRKAAERGYAAGQNNLGHMYESGRGVAKDDVEAVAWFRKAAAQGNALGQTNLERMTEKGRVVAGASNCKMLQIDQWPVRRRRGWLTIDGAINGQSVGILLDTGAMHTLIFRSAAARLGLATRRISRAWVSGVGGDSNAESADVGEFKIGGVTRKNWTMLVAGE
jgi:TPR repeat protein